MMLYFNDADGRKAKKLTGFTVRQNSDVLYGYLVQQLRSLLALSHKDYLSLSQNTTTNLIRASLPILQLGNHDVYISTHEILFFKLLFQTGTLPTRSTTHPNYAHQYPEAFIKKRVRYFQPATILKTLQHRQQYKNPAIIIVSHVSRITGARLVTDRFYRAIKRVNPKNILIVDGGQAVGAIPIDVKKISDVYFGVTSKFIGAEPHISFCWIRKALVSEYNIAQWALDSHKYSREIFSAVHALRGFQKEKLNIHKIRMYIEQQLTLHNIPFWKPRTQIDNILLLPVAKDSIDDIITALSRKKVYISSNTHWGISEPKVSCLRISLSSRSTRHGIDCLIDALIPYLSFSKKI